MPTSLSEAARWALETTDWRRIDAMTDADIARQIAANPDAAPDMAPKIDVRAIRRAAGMTLDEFATAYHFSRRALALWERGARQPNRAVGARLRAIGGAPEGRPMATAPD